jgi:hypothetical protein
MAGAPEEYVAGIAERDASRHLAQPQAGAGHHRRGHRRRLRFRRLLSRWWILVFARAITRVFDFFTK